MPWWWKDLGGGEKEGEFTGLCLFDKRDNQFGRPKADATGKKGRQRRKGNMTPVDTMENNLSLTIINTIKQDPLWMVLCSPHASGWKGEDFWTMWEDSKIKQQLGCWVVGGNINRPASSGCDCCMRVSAGAVRAVLTALMHCNARLRKPWRTFGSSQSSKVKKGKKTRQTVHSW